MLDRHDLSAPSTHIGRDELRADLPRVIADAQMLGHVFVEHDERASPLASARASYSALREILTR